jgi:hypothetical protein
VCTYFGRVLRDIVRKTKDIRLAPALRPAAALRRRERDLLTQQMLRDRFSRRPSPFEGLDDGRRRQALRRQLILSSVGLDVVQLHLQLVDGALLERAPWSVRRSCLICSLNRAINTRRWRQLPEHGRERSDSAHAAPFALPSRRPLGEDQRIFRSDVGRKRISIFRSDGIWGD